MSIDPDAPTLGEIARTLYDVRQDIRDMRGQHVRTDVYAVAHRALQDSVDELKRELQAMQDARRQAARMAAGALVTAAGSLLVQFVITVVSSR